MRLLSKVLGLYRIDTVPWALKPLFWLYGYGLGLPCALYAFLVRYTSHVEYVREPGADERQRAVFCAWHEQVWSQFIALLPLGRYAALSHPLWYMEPVYVMLRTIGMREFAWGSAGNDGRAAASALVDALAEDARLSAVINPDGPAGPPRHAKKGIFHIAAQSSLPIVPLRFECSFAIRLPGWDRKIFPLPFGRIRIRVGAPIRITEACDLDARVAELERRLGA